MTVVAPTRLADAVAALAADPGAQVVAGGTDVMVEVNTGRRRLDTVLCVDRVEELRAWSHDPAGGFVDLGAAMTFTELLGSPVAELAPVLAEAARAIGSVQVRNAGTLGGSLGTASPAGDALVALTALGASVELVSSRGARTLALPDFLLGPHRSARRDDELVTTIRVPTVGRRQRFAKVGGRSAMTVAVASAALVVDGGRRDIRLALGAVGPTVARAPDAEAWLAERVDWDGSHGVVADDLAAVARRFGDLAAASCRPQDDHRSTAAYRRHAIGTLATRLAVRALS